jgi:hypothetical protein
MRSFSLALLALLGLPISPATAASDAEVLRQFGMLGRIAVDCKAPHSKANPYLIYAVSPQGKLTRTLRMIPDLDGTFPMRNVHMLGPNLLQHDETGRQSELTITVAKIDGKFRSWRSVRADGTVLIADGKFPKTGEPTIVFEKCRN